MSYGRQPHYVFDCAGGLEGCLDVPHLHFDSRPVARTALAQFVAKIHERGELVDWLAAGRRVIGDVFCPEHPGIDDCRRWSGGRRHLEFWRKQGPL